VLTLRPARPDDGDFFYATRRAAFRVYVENAHGTPWDDAFHRPIFDREFAELPLEIVERAGAPVGYQAVSRRVDHWWLDEIALVDGERGRGIGTELVTAIMDAARAAGMPLRLSVLDGNPALRLYTRLGFRVTSVEPPRTKLEWR